MKTFLKTTLLAASLAVAGLAASVPNASAGNVDFSITIGGGQDFYRDQDWRDDYRGRDDWRGGRRGDWGHERRHERRGDICVPGLALEKARYMGIRHARIVDVDRRTVQVRGFKYGRPSGAVFANDRHCPLIAAR
jgi:hypothetical protein